VTITRSQFGIIGSTPVEAFTITNAHGLSATVISYGARLTRMHAPDRNGIMADIVLGFDDVASYAASDTYFGATCGRYGNRIRDAQFVLDDQVITVTANEKPNHLHGGEVGFDRRIWTATPNESDNSVTFTLLSANGEEGFPGQLIVTSTYRLTDDDRLIIRMCGMTDQTTILNMVHHSYWNLAGHSSGAVHKQWLVLEADFYTPVDEQLIPTGEVLAVAGTPFDFREPKRIGEQISVVQNGGAGRLAGVGGGYDHNWVIRGNGLRPVATVYDANSGRELRMRATEPGVQLYTGGYLNTFVVGKNKQPYCRDAGFTLETQKFPNSPNFTHFASTRLDPTKPYDHMMEITFTAH